MLTKPNHCDTPALAGGLAPALADYSAGTVASPRSRLFNGVLNGLLLPLLRLRAH